MKKNTVEEENSKLLKHTPNVFCKAQASNVSPRFRGKGHERKTSAVAWF
jgi:hypothetical protein